LSKSQKIRILLIGASGQVGFELQSRLPAFGEVIAPVRAQLDLGSEDSIREVVRSSQPAIIVNAAAYTAVDRAETERELAMRVNGIAPGILAEEAKRCRAILLHYSTDYVFDGQKNVPYLEEDQTAPLNEYGRTKLIGEQRMAAIGGAYVILRTSWVYAPRGGNFLLTMLRRGAESDSLRIVDDQTGSPTSAAAIGDATLAVLQNCLKRDSNSYDYVRELCGVYHASCSGQTSWHGFARSIFEEAKKTELGPKLKVQQVVPISTEEYPTPARRPRYSVLSNEKRLRTFNFQLPDWRDCLNKVMRQLIEQKILSI
jgi:dTDP-4-dehydrorhamnose reductase